MKEQEKKDKIKAGIATTVVFLFLFIFLHFCGLSYIYPPPPAKKVILIEMTMERSGGGGGGNEHPRNNKITTGSAENIVRQLHDVSLPSIPSSKNNNPAQQAVAEEVVPKPDASAMYKPGMGGGSGGGSGTGTGSGVGSGFGAGSGSGSGGGSGSGTGTGIGDGTGSRGYIHMPDLTTSEVGKVYVRVHVAADGTVLDASIISAGTTITNSKIQEECVRKAKTAKYKAGKEEFRIIMFSL